MKWFQLNTRSGPFLLAVALFSSLLFRLPFAGYTVLDWDESSYILLGDGILHGQRAYVDMLENKPPILFYVFAFFQWVAGKSIVGIRWGGIVIVALAAWWIALFTRQAFGDKSRPWTAAVILPLLATIIPRSGTVYAEHATILFLSGVLLLLGRERQTLRSGLLLGLAMSLAVMCRTNIAYPALLLGVASFGLPLAPGVRRFPFLATFAAGALLPVALIMMVYRNHLELLYRGVVLTPLAYSEGGGLFSPLWWSNMKWLVVRWLNDEWLERSLFPSALAGLLGLFILIREGWNGRVRSIPVPVLALVIGAAATAAGIAAGGASFSHYAIQLVPFGVPLIACALGGEGRGHRWRAGVFAVLLIGFEGGAWFQAARYPFPNREKNENARRDYVAEMVAYLEQRGARGHVLYLMDGHIGYWLLDAQRPTRIVHPSNITKVALMRASEGPDWTPQQELDAIFSRRPAFVVVPEPAWYLETAPDVKQHLLRELARDYRFERRIGKLGVYARNDFPPPSWPPSPE